MADSNGQQGNLSRLDRIEAAIEHMMGEHEAFRAEHNMLLRSQVLLQDSLMKRENSVGRFQIQVSEIAGKLDGLIGLVDRDHREFHERLRRLEEK